MGMEKKLNAAYQLGFKDGQKEADEHAELIGQIKGAVETWDIMEAVFLQIDGIGPKTREKILIKVQEYARAEKKKLEGATNEQRN